MAKQFLECSFDQPYLLPPDIRDWLPSGHLARFLADVADQLDLSKIYAAYERRDGRGLAAYHPLMMTRLLLYGYAIGLRSSRAIEKATYDDLACRFLSANQHPDHDTIASFRQQHLAALADLFSQALALCRRAGLMKVGSIAIDGTKICAQASDRRCMRLQQIREQEDKLHTLVNELLQSAAETDEREDARWGKGRSSDELPAELADAQKRLERLRKARAELEQEVAQQLSEAEAGYPKRKPGPKPLAMQASAEDVNERERRKQARKRARRAMAAGHSRHFNFTDPDCRMMRDASTGHIVAGYNAQLAVEGTAQIIVAAAVTQQATDQQQLVPMARAAMQAMAAMPEHILADAGYWSSTQIADPVFAGTNLLVPPDGHNTVNRRLRVTNTAAQSMRAKLATAAGAALYTARQHIVEPVFAHIKEQRRFRRFSFRGLAKVSAEWSIVCLTHNLLKLHRSRLHLGIA